jgi:dTDP-4-dehydrorhamnose reductase
MSTGFTPGGPVWITGGAGLIGNYLARRAAELFPGAEVRALRRSDLELTDAEEVRREFDRARPAVILHCAAMTKPPDCQARPAEAWRVNVDATATLVELAADIPLVFFSTDIVFDGRTGGYDEHSPVNPVNRYGETKAAAEALVLKNPGHTVIRTSLNGGVSPTGDRGFNEAMRAAWRAGKTLELFTDEIRCPIAASVTARAVWELVIQRQAGIFHLAGAEALSRWQIGRLLADRWPELNPRLTPCTLRDYHGPPRAPDTSMDCAKIQRLLSFPLPGLTKWLVDNPAECF